MQTVWWLVLVGWLALSAGAASGSGAAQGSGGPDDRWLLEEFDWGDSPILVEESIRFSRGFRCNAIQGQCIAPVVLVEDEALLVKFAYHHGELYRIRVLTPDLDPVEGRPHLERVWGKLLAYLERHRGEPAESAETLPDLEALTPGRFTVTHRWKRPDQEIQLGIGRRTGDLFVAASFLDPERAAAARRARGVAPPGPDGEESDPAEAP